MSALWDDWRKATFGPPEYQEDVCVRCGEEGLHPWYKYRDPDSDGVPHWGEVWYSLTPASEHSPTAAAMLANATDSDAIVAAVDKAIIRPTCAFHHQRLDHQRGHQELGVACFST